MLLWTKCQKLHSKCATSEFSTIECCGFAVWFINWRLDTKMGIWRFSWPQITIWDQTYYFLCKVWENYKIQLWCREITFSVSLIIIDISKMIHAWLYLFYLALMLLVMKRRLQLLCFPIIYICVIIRGQLSLIFFLVLWKFFLMMS